MWSCSDFFLLPSSGENILSFLPPASGENILSFLLPASGEKVPKADEGRNPALCAPHSCVSLP
jgi:hypothetical protein